MSLKKDKITYTMDITKQHLKRKLEKAQFVNLYADSFEYSSSYVMKEYLIYIFYNSIWFKHLLYVKRNKIKLTRKAIKHAQIIVEKHIIFPETLPKFIYTDTHLGNDEYSEKLIKTCLRNLLNFLRKEKVTFNLIITTYIKE